MADEKKKEEKPVDATSSSRQKEADTTERRDEAVASTGEEADSSERRDEAVASTPDWKDRYARLLADFDNFKKRTARDREDTYRFAEADILKDILPAVDNLQLALAAAKTVDAESSPRQKEGDNTSSAHESFVKGVKLVYDSLLKALKDHGAEPFDSVGKALDTEKMEAIATLPSADVEEGMVSIESKKGWMLKEKVLRAAQVVVSAGKPA